MRKAPPSSPRSLLVGPAGAVALAALLALPACAPQSGVRLEEPIGETHTTASATAGARAQGRDEPRASFELVVTDELRDACRLQHHEEPPRFAFEGARLRALGQDDLVAIARCFVSGSLGGRSLQIIGYTDPRGGDDYAEKLGVHRADAAKQVLVEHGVSGERIALGSRGSRDAKGTNEATWAHDRRVEVRLAEPRSQSGLALPVSTIAPPSVPPPAPTVHSLIGTPVPEGTPAPSSSTSSPAAPPATK